MEYKHLTDDMKKCLDEEIQKNGKNALYDIIEKNVLMDRIIEAQNKPGAFDMNNPRHVPNWYYELNKPKIIEGYTNLSLEEEILYYINPKRFKNISYE